MAMLAVNTLLEITEIARAFRRFAFWDYFVIPSTLHPKPLTLALSPVTKQSSRFGSG